MDPVIAGEFRVKGNGKLIIILYAHDASLHRGKYFHAVRYAFHIRRAYEFHRQCADSLEIAVGVVEAAKLPAISIALYSHRQGADMHRFFARDMLR